MDFRSILMMLPIFQMTAHHILYAVVLHGQLSMRREMLQRPEPEAAESLSRIRTCAAACRVTNGVVSV
jgi:hypothetical protein